MVQFVGHSVDFGSLRADKIWSACERSMFVAWAFQIIVRLRIIYKINAKNNNNYYFLFFKNINVYIILILISFYSVEWAVGELYSYKFDHDRLIRVEPAFLSQKPIRLLYALLNHVANHGNKFYLVPVGLETNVDWWGTIEGHRLLPLAIFQTLPLLRLARTENSDGRWP